jgi:hypothetical protein
MKWMAHVTHTRKLEMLVWEISREETTKIPKYRWEDNIKIVCEGMNRIEMAHDGIL